MKLISTLACVSFTFFSLKLNSQTIFQRSLDFGNDDYGNELKIFNGNCFIIGSTNSSGAGGFDAILAKTDLSGNVLFQNQLGGSSTEFGTKLIISASGKIISAGRSNSFSTPPNHDFLVFQTDENGTLEWTSVFGTDSLDYALAIAETADGGFIVAGQTKPNDRFDVMMVKISASGSVEWNKTIGSPNANEVVFDIKSLGNMGYALFGYSGIGSIGMNEGMILITDTLGNLNGVYVLGGSSDDDIRNIADGNQNSFYAAGNTRSFGAGQSDIFLAKFDVSSMPPSLVWFKTYGGSADESLSSIVQDGNNYIISGSTQSFGTGDNGIAFYVNDAGEVQWAGTYGDNGADRIQHLNNNSMGGFLGVGFSTSFGGVANNLYLINTDSSGNTNCFFNSISITGDIQNATFVDTITSGFISSVSSGFASRTATAVQNTATVTNTVLCSTSTEEKKHSGDFFSIYPNPADHILYFDFPIQEKVDFKLINSSGKIIHSGNLGTGIYTSSIDISSYSSGIYQLILNVSGWQFLSKITIIRP